MKQKLKHPRPVGGTPESKQRPTFKGPVFRLQDNIRAPGYRINMLSSENFTVALLGEFGFTQQTIATAMNMTMAQVVRRLRFAKVQTSAYRRGESAIAQLILRNVAKAGVPQLRQFASEVLTNQLHQLGWNNVEQAIRPELLAAPTPAPEKGASHD